MGNYCQICFKKNDKNGKGTRLFSKDIWIDGVVIELLIAFHLSCLHEENEKDDQIIIEVSDG